MFTVDELVAQGYTVQHARQFLDRQAVRARNEKATLAARRKASSKAKAAKPAPAPTLRERMTAVQAKTTQRAKAAHQREIRDWAKSVGHKLNDYGRIPASIVQEFNHAHEQSV